MMKVLKTIIILVFLFLLLFCTLDLPAQAQVQDKDDQERLEYHVSVETQLVPIFAVDKKGNPVFDLKPAGGIVHFSYLSTTIYAKV